MTYLDKLKLGFKIGWPAFVGVIGYPIFISIIRYFDPMLILSFAFTYLIIVSFLVEMGIIHNIEKYGKDFF